jgi:hypothetical protein
VMWETWGFPVHDAIRNPAFMRISLLFNRRSLDLRGPLRTTSAAL